MEQIKLTPEERKEIREDVYPFSEAIPLNDLDELIDAVQVSTIDKILNMLKDRPQLLMGISQIVDLHYWAIRAAQEKRITIDEFALWQVEIADQILSYIPDEEVIRQEVLREVENTMFSQPFEVTGKNVNEGRFILELNTNPQKSFEKWESLKEQKG